MLNYFQEIKKSMEFLASKEDSIFVGQTTIWPGTACHKSFIDISKDKLVEVPIFETSQFGLAIGLGLQGYTVLNLFVRLNFLLCAIDPLVNYLDKLDDISHNEHKCRVITRAVIGSEKPLWPGRQHLSPKNHAPCDYTEALKLMCSNVNVVRLDEAEQIFPAYQKAYESDKSSLLIEWADRYEN